MRILQKYSAAVEKGIQLGRKLGFPTANLYLSNPLTIPFGIYVVRVTHNEKQYFGVANYGTKPTLTDDRVAIEVYIFDFDSTIYGEQITVEFIEHIRQEKKFETIEKLRKQIEKDVEYAKESIKNISAI